jgi:hypothetical protein
VTLLSAASWVRHEKTAARAEERGNLSHAKTSGPVCQVVNPPTGKVVETFEYATDQEIESALAELGPLGMDEFVNKRGRTAERPPLGGSGDSSSEGRAFVQVRAGFDPSAQMS